MNPQVLKKAQDALKVRDVYQRAVTAKLTEGYDPKFETDTVLEVHFKHQVMRSELLAPVGSTDADQIFRVYVDLGVRWTRQIQDAESEAIQEDAAASVERIADKDVLGLIEASYVAEYDMSESPGQEALDEFALHNASYHIWPYFREFVVSQCCRMNVPKIMLPMVQLASNREQ